MGRLQGSALSIFGYATIHANSREGGWLGELLNLAVDLSSEFASWGDDDCSRWGALLGRGVDYRADTRHAERKRLA